MRNKNTENFIKDIELQSENIFTQFESFSDGCRVLLLLHRKKDGGHTKEESRTTCTRVTFKPEQYKTAIKELLFLKATLYPDTRLYASVNSRNIKSVIRRIEQDLIDCHYTDEVQRDNVYKKLLRSPRHFLMQQVNCNDKLFVLDVDNVEGKDIMGECLQEIAKNNIEVLYQYPTKNGWHIITKPFNPALVTIADIKKDGLMLLAY